MLSGIWRNIIRISEHKNMEESITDANSYIAYIFLGKYLLNMLLVVSRNSLKGSQHFVTNRH